MSDKNVKKMTLDELRAEFNEIDDVNISETTILKNRGIFWVKSNNLIIIINSFLVLT
jgi:hypothetical protein